jgi:hypothetical protein
LIRGALKFHGEKCIQHTLGVRFAYRGPVKGRMLGWVEDDFCQRYQHLSAEHPYGLILLFGFGFSKASSDLSDAPIHLWPTGRLLEHTTPFASGFLLNPGEKIIVHLADECTPRLISRKVGTPFTVPLPEVSVWVGILYLSLCKGFGYKTSRLSMYSAFTV